MGAETENLAKSSDSAATDENKPTSAEVQAMMSSRCKLKATESAEDRAYRQSQERRLKKNLIVFCSSLLLEYSVLNALSNLQSSLNSEKNLGVICLFASWIANALSCLFLPTVLLKLVGYKWAIVICQSCLSAFILANVRASIYTLLPTAIMVGAANGVLWTFQGSYISFLASEYAQVSKLKLERVLIKFFGIFMMIFQLNQTLGNLVSSIVLKKRVPKMVLDANQTLSELVLNVTVQARQCGINIAHVEDSGNAEVSMKPDKHLVYILCFIFLGLSITGSLIIVFFLDNINPVQNKKTFEAISETFKLFKNIRVWLILPIIGFFAIVTTFFVVDVSRSFLTCAYGVHYVGYFFVCWGLSSSVFSYLVEPITKRLGRYPCMVTVIGTPSLILTYLIFGWNSQDTVHFYLIFGLAILFGAFEAVWGTIMNTIIGYVFPQELQGAAYSANRFCLAFMFIVAFGYSGFLSVKFQIIIVICSSVLAASSYTTLRILLKRNLI